MAQKPWINYHHLLYFKTIALEGGIAKAAKKLRLGQPTLSTQLKQFESVLGQTLFDRTNRQLQLSEAGKIVLGYANEIFRLGDELLDVLSDQHVSTKIQVQIGITDTVPKHLALKVFQQAHSDFDCVVSMVGGHGDELLRELKAHRVDLVISNHAPAVGDGSGFYAKSIAKMPVVVCGAGKFSHLKRGFPNSLHEQPFVVPTIQTKLRGDLDHFFKLKEIRVDVIAEVQDTSLQKLIAISGDALVALPAPAAEDLIATKDLFAIGSLNQVHEELWLIAAERRIQNPVAGKIMKTFELKQLR